MSVNHKRRTCDGLDVVNSDLMKVRKTLLNSSATESRNVTLPDKDGTVAMMDDITTAIAPMVTTNTAQTISGLKTFSTGPKVGNTTLTSIATGSKTLTLPDETDTLVTLDATQTLRNKTLRQPFITDGTDVTKRLQFSMTGVPTGSTVNMIVGSSTNITFPNGTITLASTGGTQTLSNKTLATLKVGTSGTSMTQISSGTPLICGVVIPANANVTIGNIPLVGFATVPKMQLTLKTPTSGGPQNWDRVLVTYDGNTSTATNIVVTGVNFGGASTGGTAYVDWIAYV